MTHPCTRRDALRFILMGGGMLAATSLTPLASLAGAAAVPVKEARLFMGTIVGVTVARAPEDLAREALDRAFAKGMELARVFTRFESSSPLATLNAGGVLRDVPPALAHLLERSVRLHRVTGGAFDPTILPVLNLLEGRAPGSAPDAGEMREALFLIGAEHVRVDGGSVSLARTGMGLTLDGIAKGLVADAMSQELASAGCPDHLVDAGGDIVARGVRNDGAPWRVAVEDPAKRGRHPRVVALPAGGAVATSGVYEAFHRPHLLNPANGRGSDLVGVTVTAPDGLMADALATAMSVMPPGEAVRLADSLPGCACCILHRDGLTRVSARWPEARA